MKKVLAIVLALCFLLAFTACNSGKTTSGANSTGSTGGTPGGTDKTPVTVTFWNGWTGSDGDYLKELVNEYNEINTDNVTIQMDQMEHMALSEKLVAAIASNSCPNLHLGTAVSEYTLDGAYIPIDDIWEKTGLDKNDFDPTLLNGCYYQDHLYGIPFQVSSVYLFWNKDLFKQAGLDPDKAPATWEDLLSASKAIDALGGNIIGGGPNFTNYLQVGAIMRSYGGTVIGDDGKGGYFVALTDPKYIDGNKKALDYIQRYSNETLITTSGNLEDGFNSGVVGLNVNGAWQVAGAKDNNIDYGISLLPKGPVGGPCQPGFPISMCVMKGTEGREYDGTLAFIKYWNDKDTTLKDHCPAYYWTTKMGYQSYLLSTSTDTAVVNDKTYQVTASYSKYVDNTYPSTFWNSFAMVSPLQSLSESVSNNVASIEDSLKTAQTQLEELVDDMHQKEADLGLS